MEIQSWSLLIELVVLLAFCLVFGGLASRFGQSPIVGYLFAGMLLGGPGSLHLVRSEQHIESIAELGVSLLLFSLGLEFSWARVKGLGTRMLASGALQVALTAAFASVVAWLFRLPATEAIAVGAMVSLSSTATVLRVLVDQGELDSLHGRNSLTVLLVQDMAVVPLAILMTVLAGTGTPLEVVGFVSQLVVAAVVLVVVLYVLINVVSVRALASLTLEQNRELTVLLAVVVGLGSAWGAHAAGLSPALGAFAAGMFLGSSAYATQIRADVSSLRVVLLTLFFGAVGMVADPVWIITHAGFVLTVTAMLVVGKALLVWTILRVMGESEGVAAATGLCLAQVGEFAFVLAGATEQGEVIRDATYLVIVSSAIVSLFLTPYLVSAAPRLATWVERRRGPGLGLGATAADQESPDVVIIGFGPAGQSVGRALCGTPARVVVLDLNQEAKKSAEGMGFEGQIGDAQQLDVLEHAGVRSARCVVVTLPTRSAALAVLGHVRQIAPHAYLVARSRYQIHKSEFESAGAHAVIGDEEEVGRRLSEHVTAQLASLGEAALASQDSPEEASARQ